MIPLRLDVTNFLSYQDTSSVDLNEIRLACITGQNGAGKSSLLEAMTWALFGQSRATSDDDVVNRLASVRGESAEVRFTFGLEDAIYRVVRKRKRRGRASLEFQLQSGSDGSSWTTLTETKMKETQAKIEQTLRMNYESFVNVSFFLQGQADAFTTQTAGKRKEILADLLGVNEWDTYKEQAAEQRKGAENDLRLMEARLGDVESELLEKEAREQALAVAEAEAKTVSTQLEAQEALLRTLQKAADAVAQQNVVVSSLKREQGDVVAKSAEIEATLAERVAQRETYTQILARKEAITDAHQQYETLNGQVAVWQKKADAFNQAQGEMRPFEDVIGRAESRLRAEKANLETRSQQVETMRMERGKIEGEIGEKEGEKSELSARLETLDGVEARLDGAREVLNRLMSARRVDEEKMAQLRRDAADVEQTAGEKEGVTAGIVKVETTIAQLEIAAETLNKQRIELTQLRTEVNALTTSERARLKEQLDEIDEKMSALKAQSGESCPYCQQTLTDEHLALVLGGMKKERKRVDEAYRLNQKRTKEVTARMAELDRVVRDADDPAVQIQSWQLRLARGEAKLEEIERAVTAWEARGGAKALAELEARLGDKRALGEAKTAVDTLKTELDEKRTVTAQLATIETAQAKAETRLAQIVAELEAWDGEGKGTFATVTSQLETADFEQDARRELARLTADAETIKYDAAAHRQAETARDGLGNVAAEFQALGKAEAAVDPLNSAIADLEKQAAEQTKRTTMLEKSVAEAEARLGVLTADVGDVDGVENDVFALRGRRIKADQNVGSVKQKVDVLEQVRESGELYRAEQVTIRERIQRLKMLEKACGRDGIQALLIEQALPSIEENANELLDRLSDGQMRVAFLTQEQKKTKKDELRETLKIQITDGSGERPYENFSGGEQFRINFAIRLALSRILAKRAGARLQTLVIDEGFGSQDPRGRQQLIEAINVIKPEFERIFVITHIDELKEAFPTRIEVRKTPNGSQVSVI